MRHHMRLAEGLPQAPTCAYKGALSQAPTRVRCLRRLRGPLSQAPTRARCLRRLQGRAVSGAYKGPRKSLQRISTRNGGCLASGACKDTTQAPHKERGCLAETALQGHNLRLARGRALRGLAEGALRRLAEGLYKDLVSGAARARVSGACECAPCVALRRAPCVSLRRAKAKSHPLRRISPH